MVTSVMVRQCTIVCILSTTVLPTANIQYAVCLLLVLPVQCSSSMHNAVSPSALGKRKTEVIAYNIYILGCHTYVHVVVVLERMEASNWWSINVYRYEPFKFL